MYEQQDSAERKLKRVKINLMRQDKFAFWRGIMMVGDTILSDDVPTACTDGCNEIYGRRLVEMLNEKMLAFVVLHENGHKLERHLSTWQRLYEQDARLANMACDYRINLMLHDMDPAEEFIAMPRSPDGELIGLLDERFRGMDVPAIFRVLKQEQEEQGGNGGDGSGGDNFDDHDWDKASERSAAQEEALGKEIDRAARQGAMEHRKVNGDGAGNLARELAELLEPKINWREVLADFVRTLCHGRDKSTWRRLNRRFLAQDIAMPSLMSERVGRIANCCDTSGSIAGKELMSLVTEMVSLAKEVRPDKIDLLYWDAAIARHEEYDDSTYDAMPNTTKPAGGGGTDVNCVFDYIEKKNIEPECAIILTDGYTPWPTRPPSYPVLWVITTKGLTAPFGVTVYMDPNI